MVSKVYPWKKICWIFSCIVFEFSSSTNSSPRDDFRLIDEEPKLIKVMEKYVQSENSRLDQLQNYTETLSQYAESFSNEDDLAFNPLAIYKAIKHLTVDLQNIKQIMVKNGYENQDQMMKEHSVNLPKMDFWYQYDEMRRVDNLRRVYNLTVQDIVNSSSPLETLTVKDCYSIGVSFADAYDYERAVNWLPNCNVTENYITRKSVLTALIESSLFVGDRILARNVSKKVLEKDRNNRLFMDLVILLSLELDDWLDAREYHQWESFNTCCGDYDHELAYRNLRCRYNRHHSPFLLLAPLKEEILSLTRPKVSIFREAVYDSELELLDKNAIEKRRPGLDKRHHSGHITDLDNREPIYDNLRHRLKDMSNLNLKTGTNFRVIQYGSGGFIRLHNDYGLPQETANQIYGFRQGIALIYFNDDFLGGSTAFPYIRVNVRPTKGSVLFWTNMKADGSQDRRADHAACPVIYGEKLACSIWFRIKYQDHWITKPEDEATLDVKAWEPKDAKRRRRKSIS